MKQCSKSAGQTLIEFALLIPVVLALILGFLDLGRAIFYYSSLSNAVREATRYAIVQNPYDEEKIKDKLVDYAFALTNTPNPLDRNDIIITLLPLDNDPKTNISITATYVFVPITPFIAPDGFTLEVQSNMRIAAHAR